MKTVIFLSAALSLGAFALASQSCTASQAFVVTGDSINVAGQTFVATSKAMRLGLEQGAVSREDFAKWVEFSDKFAAVYGPTVEAYKAAVRVKDTIAVAGLEASLSGIVAELFVFYGKVKKANLLPAGAP